MHCLTCRRWKRETVWCVISILMTKHSKIPYNPTGWLHVDAETKWRPEWTPMVNTHQKSSNPQDICILTAGKKSATNFLCESDYPVLTIKLKMCILEANENSRALPKEVHQCCPGNIPLQQLDNKFLCMYCNFTGVQRLLDRRWNWFKWVAFSIFLPFPHYLFLYPCLPPTWSWCVLYWLHGIALSKC